MKNSLLVLLLAPALAAPVRAQVDPSIGGQVQQFVVFSTSDARGRKIGKIILSNMPQLLTEGVAVLRRLDYRPTGRPGEAEECDQALIGFLDEAVAAGAKTIAIDSAVCHGPAVKAKLKQLRAQGVTAGMANPDTLGQGASGGVSGGGGDGGQQGAPGDVQEADGNAPIPEDGQVGEVVDPVDQ